LLGGVAALALAMPVTAANAAPLPFTWNPAGASTPLAGGSIVNADNYNVADFTSVSIDNSTGAFTQVGALNVLNFLNNGQTVVSSGLGSTYSIYLTFTATGQQGPIPTENGTSTNGTFATLDYRLIGTTAGSPPLSFGVSNGAVSITDPGTDVILAYGSLVPNTGFVTLTKTANGYSPTANVNLSFNECLAAGQGGICTASQAGFFVAPASGLQLQIGNFSATDTVTTLNGGPTTSFLNLNGGSGNLTFAANAVPEPASIALFGAGILALSGFARRRSRG
jgi:hypothetical protein